ncbi:MAG: biotin--[acetyl-CoA-carboxylase] ligase [Microbacteriaceae bacterium]|nr:biotin--[acetyl-CoA-carboxylase] ligase [Microbacteriaceae bacterium]
MPSQTVSAVTRADLPMASALAIGLEVIDSVPSTNAELAARERRARQPHFTSLVTLHQTAGKGRLGRTWSAPPGSSLAVSTVIRPKAIPLDRLGILTLLGGLAAREAVATQLPGSVVTVKWPNDVLIAGRKVCGVLAEVVPQTGAIVLGVGINTAMTQEQLPVPTATSIAIESPDPVPAAELADRVLTEFLAALAGLVARFEAARGDIDRAGLRDQLEAACGTIGAQVSVQQPDGSKFTGRALGIGADGSLLVASGGSADPAAILAGDVTHLRYQ